MTERILGLDIGIASLGWAVVDYDKEDRSNNRIIKSGVRIFTIAENPKTGESLALPRRLSRGARRTIKRKRKRMSSIKKLLIAHLGLSQTDLFREEDNDYTIYNQKEHSRVDIWQLRDEALKRELTAIELARVLTHIAKRRGYKSNRKVDEQGDKEGKKVLNAIEQNRKLLDGYLTIGQAIYETTKTTGIRRNKKDNYSRTVERGMLEDEVKIIFEKQNEFGSGLTTEKLKNSYLELFLKQKDFASVDGMVGFCTLEGHGEKRAPKRAYSSEEFVTLTKLINTKIVNKDDIERGLTQEELEKTIELCRQSEQPTYIKIRDTIGLKDGDYFKGVDFYEIDKKTGEVARKATKFKSAFKGFHKLRKETVKALSKTHWHNLSEDKKLLNEIAKIFSYHKRDDKIEEELKKLEFKSLTKDEKQILIEALIASISFDKFLYLSIKAIDRLIIYMREGKRYDEAVKLAGYKKIEGEKSKFLRALNQDEALELTNPVVKRAISQTRKVINALIREYRVFDKVHIELTREIKKSHQDRNKVKKGQEEYQKFKQQVVDEFIEDFGREPKGNELLKFRLWKEQGGYCAYSGYKGDSGYIDPTRLISELKYAEIDHILPFSRSLEDNLNNKVLCLAKENQDKRDRTPYEYFNDKGRDWYAYEVFIKNLKGIKRAKRQRLLKKNFDENSAKEFRDRNANDTAYMSRFIKNFIEDNLELKSQEKQKVFTRNGMLTNMLRHNWHIGNKSRTNHLHHAVDAIIIAFATQSEVQRLSTLSAKKDGFIYTKSEVKAGKLKFISPMDNFRDEVQKSIDDMFVSFAPRKKISGETNSPNPTTINPKKYRKYIESHTKLFALYKAEKQKPIDIFMDKLIKKEPWISTEQREEIQKNQPKRFSDLRVLLKLDKDFEFKSITYTPKETFLLRGGSVEKGEVKRIDVFKKDGDFFFVPIYPHEIETKRIRDLNRVIDTGRYKKYKEGISKIDETFIFQFSLFKNDLLVVKQSGGSALEYVYFSQLKPANGQIFFLNHYDADKKTPYSMYIHNIEKFEKYAIDILGNISTNPILEKRLGTKLDRRLDKKG